MKIVVVGSDARAHALAHTFDRQGHEALATPGNAGIPWSTDVAPLELDADLFVISPEQPLVDGLADELRAQDKLVFGPGADGAQLEGSKIWMKYLLNRAGVPTAKFSVARTHEEVRIGVQYFFDRRMSTGLGCVIKTDGLAAGKGVGVFKNVEELGVYTAKSDAIKDGVAKLDGSFGDAGRQLVIEELLPGYEVSIFAVCNGEDYMLLPGAVDYKRLLDGDRGPNTGGMGSYSPAGNEHMHEEWAEVCIRPVLEELKRRGIDYRGVLYAGLMITPEGPKVLEFNVRFGDPEIQSVLARSTSDFAELLCQAAAGEDMVQPEFGADYAVTVVVAAEGYPENPLKGQPIQVFGDDSWRSANRVTPFYAGVARDASGALTVNGGRVLCVTALGTTKRWAHESAVKAAHGFTWPGAQMRNDIGREHTL